MPHNKRVESGSLRRRFAPTTTGRRIAIRCLFRAWRAQAADEADSGRHSLQFSRLSRPIRRPVIHLTIYRGRNASKQMA